ncbi:hypothetical protein KCM76_23810 [Zooshikella marina]|uniref:hypothetical protein n=1 Tax=Zooshikella ganghwensis TaxID=202772 RepID=UPI001BAFD1BC|nr:hypothetical protein [Zooshikella ganghwensis]MBU2709043.1 hypothetical protein [Zooshikella ganghwensis]
MNEVRKKGLILLVVGLAVTVAMIVIANYMMGEGNWTFIGYGFALPGAIAMVGIMQLVAGMPFDELASRWNLLAGWQRGVLGTLFFALSCVVIFGVIFLYVTIAYG